MLGGPKCRRSRSRALLQTAHTVEASPRRRPPTSRPYSTSLLGREKRRTLARSPANTGCQCWSAHPRLLRRCPLDVFSGALCRHRRAGLPRRYLGVAVTDRLELLMLLLAAPRAVCLLSARHAFTSADRRKEGAPTVRARCSLLCRQSRETGPRRRVPHRRLYQPRHLSSCPTTVRPAALRPLGRSIRRDRYRPLQSR